MGLEQVDQTVDVMDAWILDLAIREYGLEQLLDGLLGVEADHVIGDSESSASLSRTSLSALALLSSSSAWSWLSRCGKDAALGQRLVEHRALDLAPLGDMVSAYDDHIGRDA